MYEHLYRSAKVSNIALASVRREPWSTNTTATFPLAAALLPAAALACGRVVGILKLATSCIFRAARLALLAQAPIEACHLRAALLESAAGCRWVRCSSEGSTIVCVKATMDGNKRRGGSPVNRGPSRAGRKLYVQRFDWECSRNASWGRIVIRCKS